MLAAVALLCVALTPHPSDRPPASFGFTIARYAADGSPVRWCAPMHVVVNPTGGPPDALAAVRTAVAHVSAAAGLPVTVDGTTRSSPTADYPKPGRPVLVAWVRPGTGPLANDGSAGVSEPAWVDAPDGSSRYVSGLIVLNEAQTDLIEHGYATNREVALLEHELGHILGLGHVPDPGEVMNPTVGAAADLGAGDRAGLHAVGGRGC